MVLLGAIVVVGVTVYLTFFSGSALAADDGAVPQPPPSASDLAWRDYHDPDGFTTRDVVNDDGFVVPAGTRSIGGGLIGKALSELST